VAIDAGHELKRFHWKVEAGAEYAITQPVFDPAQLEAFLESVHDLGATQASLTSTLEPITAVVLGALVLHSPMTGLQWCGAVLVVVAAVLGIRSTAERTTVHT